MVGVLGKLGALATAAGSTVVSLGCCAGVLGPSAAIAIAGGLFEWVPLAWRLPLLYASLAVAVGSLACGWRRHRRTAPLALAVAGAAAILYPLHEATDVRVLQLLVWLGAALLVVGTGWDMWLAARRPACGAAAREGASP